MEKHVFGDAPNRARNEILDMAEDVFDDEFDSAEELAVDMFKYTMELSNRLTVNMERLPLAHRNKQMESVEDFIAQIIDAVDPVVYSLVSGNHNRDSAGGDEAYDLKDKVEKLDEDAYNGAKTVHVFDAGGDKHGGYGTIVREFSGTRVTYQHKMKGGKHEHRRKADQVLTGNTGSDEVHVNHHHTPFGWFTTGTAGTESAAFKGPDPYSTVNGFGAPVYGGIIKFSNEPPEDHPGSDMIYHAWHHVYDETLENGDFEGDELDDFHTTLADKMAERYSDMLGMDVNELREELTEHVHRTNADNA
jgi:hypothetical protein